MKHLSAADVHARKVAELGLDPSALDLTSIEALSGALRRAASFLCPCAARTLVRAVVRPLDGLIADLAALTETVEDVLEAVVAHGDLLEHREHEEMPSRARAAILYSAPPSFVARRSGGAVLLGVASDQASALPEEFEERIEYVAHVRRLQGTDGDDLRAELVKLGLIELSYESWLRVPSLETAAQHVADLDRLLEAAPPSLDVPGLTVLDPTRSVRYYRGRWVDPRRHSGRFMGRRTQAYGADLWCYVELRDGRPERFIDLPLVPGRTRGCDDAWWLQMAIDAQRGEPQQVRVRPGPRGTRVLEFFSPLPMWARRRLDALGELVPALGCLFAYCLAERETPEELLFVRERLWLRETQEER